jgi:hypothetical protein
MMISTAEHDKKVIYICGVCGLGYSDKITAEACEAYCSAHNACSLEITRKAVYKPFSTQGA